MSKAILVVFASWFLRLSFGGHEESPRCLIFVKVILRVPCSFSQTQEEATKMVQNDQI